MGTQVSAEWKAAAMVVACSVVGFILWMVFVTDAP
jgi:hypothetical protein